MLPMTLVQSLLLAGESWSKVKQPLKFFLISQSVDLTLALNASWIVCRDSCQFQLSLGSLSSSRLIWTYLSNLRWNWDHPQRPGQSSWDWGHLAFYPFIKMILQIMTGTMPHKPEVHIPYFNLTSTSIKSFKTSDFSKQVFPFWHYT